MPGIKKDEGVRESAVQAAFETANPEARGREAAEAFMAIVEVLSKLDPDDRRRVMAAAAVFLGNA